MVSCAIRTLYQATGRIIIILHVGYRLNHSHSLHKIWSVCSSGKAVYSVLSGKNSLHKIWSVCSSGKAV